MSLLSLRIHIVPVGFDPPPRIIVPLVRYRADSAFLVSYTKDNEIAESNLRRVKESIRKKIPSCEIKTLSTDVWDLFACLETYRTIFSDNSGDHIFVNVSTGSKITSITGMLACMLWGGRPYYAKLNYTMADASPRKRDSEAVEVPGIDDLPVYSIHKPSKETLTVLSIIKRAGGSVTKKDLIRALQSDEFNLIPNYGKDATRSAPHSKLRAILLPLTNEWNFATITSRGRKSDVTLTPQGERALKIFGAK